MINTLLQRLQQTDFEDLQGTVLTMEVPVGLDFLNTMIKEAIKEVEVLEEVRITAMQEETVTILVRTSIFTFRERIITGRIVKHLDLQRPAIQIEILEGLKFTGRKLVAMALPDGMELEERVLCISLNHFLLTTPMSQSLWKLVKQANLITRQDDFLLQLHIQS